MAKSERGILAGIKKRHSEGLPSWAHHTLGHAAGTASSLAHITGRPVLGHALNAARSYHRTRGFNVAYAHDPEYKKPSHDDRLQRGLMGAGLIAAGSALPFPWGAFARGSGAALVGNALASTVANHYSPRVKPGFSKTPEERAKQGAHMFADYVRPHAMHAASETEFGARVLGRIPRYGDTDWNEVFRREPAPTRADWDTLGVNRHASEADIHRAYRQQAKQWHPDRFATASAEEQAQSAERMTAINKAHDRIVRGVFRQGYVHPDKKQDRDAQVERNVTDLFKKGKPTLREKIDFLHHLGRYGKKR